MIPTFCLQKMKALCNGNYIPHFGPSWGKPWHRSTTLSSAYCVSTFSGEHKKLLPHNRRLWTLYCRTWKGGAFVFLALLLPPKLPHIIRVILGLSGANGESMLSSYCCQINEHFCLKKKLQQTTVRAQVRRYSTWNYSCDVDTFLIPPWYELYRLVTAHHGKNPTAGVLEH